MYDNPPKTNRRAPLPRRCGVYVAWIVYGMSFFLTVDAGHREPVSLGKGPGFSMFIVGLVCPWWWAANPLLWFGSYLLMRMPYRKTLCVTVCSLAAISALTASTQVIGSGYILWAASMVVLLVVSLATPRLESETEAVLPTDSTIA